MVRKIFFNFSGSASNNKASAKLTNTSGGTVSATKIKVFFIPRKKSSWYMESENKILIKFESPTNPSLPEINEYLCKLIKTPYKKGNSQKRQKNTKKGSINNIEMLFFVFIWILLPGNIL